MRLTHRANRVPDSLKPTVARALADRRAERDGSEPPSMADRVVLRAPCAGAVEWIDILEGVNLHEELDEETGLTCALVLSNPSRYFDPRIEIAGERIEVTEGTVIVRSSGDLVAKGDVVAWRLPP